MRLHLKLSPNTAPVPFDHLHWLTGVLHKWLGKNEAHDGLSLYSFGWLGGAKPVGEGLQFAGGAEWRVSFVSDDLSDRLRAGIRQDPTVLAGMRVYEIREQITPGFGPAARFLVDGAVLTRQNRDDGGRDHLTYENEAADETLTRTLRTRLDAAGLVDDARQTTARFDRTYDKARTKLVTLKGTRYRASECPVIIEGTPAAVQAAWLLGVGELTGMGLGALK
ncbi:MAG: CRISPR-associated endoribonuclease Cas6 [Bacteroidota bacterium]